VPTVLPGLVRSCGSMVTICSVAKVVEELTGDFTFGDENISRLNVAMDNSLPMRGVKRVGDFYGDGNKFFGMQRAAVDLVLQSDTIEILHGDEALLAIFANFINGADVGMVQRRGGPSFAAKALKGLRIA
jgi:hypothetical protein